MIGTEIGYLSYEEGICQEKNQCIKGIYHLNCDFVGLEIILMKFKDWKD